MKRGRLPLTALRSFEAAGRHLSFSRAADELFVSQAAISRQIRELEAFAGKPLFARHHRRVTLTDAGRDLLEQLTLSFDAIDLRLSAISAATAPAEVRVSVEPSLAGAWLVPRLDRFRAEHPGIDVFVDADTRLVEFRRSEVALAIRYSSGARSWPRTEAEHLIDIRARPVLSPQLLAEGPPVTAPADLARFTFLHEENRNGWSVWLRAAGADAGIARHGPIFPDAALSTHAAILGHGVALGDQLLNGDDLIAGRLVSPFPLEVPFGAYWLVAPDFEALSPSAKAFADWLRNEIQSSGAVSRQSTGETFPKS